MTGVYVERACTFEHDGRTFESGGAVVMRDLEDEGYVPTLADDSDHWPQGGYPGGETDGPDHCAAAGECLEGIDLGAYGLAEDAPLYGAESRVIGALLSDGLTDYGVEYLREMMAEGSPTPYQSALYRFWSEAFADELA